MLSNYSKAEILRKLLDEGYNVPYVLYFKVHEWEGDSHSIIDYCLSNIKSDALAVRSSSISEDTIEKSNAGVYDSLLNVSNKKDAIITAVEKVISSYDYSPNNQVLIQPMVENVAMSGVVMTKTLDDGSPYYVLNFDDTSGKTDTVTSGNSINKTVFVYNGVKESDFDSPYLLAVIKLVWQLEKRFQDTPLDIEFAVDKNLSVHLLQVRPITVANKWKAKANELVNNRIHLLSDYIENILKPRLGLFGRKTLLGLMPDWNPAEMIGVVPRPLALSLYRTLITKSTWRFARENMGYHSMPPVELMISLFGRTYIDVRCSLNSLLPSRIENDLGEKLIDLFIERLEKNPHLHDKIEFEIIPTIKNFEFSEFMELNYGNNLSREEIAKYESLLHQLTENAIDLNNNNNTLVKALEDAKVLESSQIRLNKLPKNSYQTADYINKLIVECVNWGTMPFAIAARHGFIAESFLRSAISKKAISSIRVNDFKRSIKTISSSLSFDFSQVLNGKSSKDSFLKKYGHLRPSSYDILSLSYNQRIDLFDSTYVHENFGSHEFELSEEEILAVGELLKFSGFKSITPQSLFEYIEKAIVAREYIKFVFTKHLNEIIETISKWGQEMGFSKDDLSYLEVDEILYMPFCPLTNFIGDYYNEKIHSSRSNLDLAKSLKLSYLIRSSRDVFIVPQQRSIPNFITDKQLEAAVIVISPHQADIPNLAQKIVCIEGADPGYDWIFTRNISGLITMYGGTNSHMAIRCAEYGLPAAIGCGEQTFERIIKAGKCLLDCGGKRLLPIQY
jgi:hypothetical protein